MALPRAPAQPAPASSPIPVGRGWGYFVRSGAVLCSWGGVECARGGVLRSWGGALRSGVLREVIR